MEYVEHYQPKANEYSLMAGNGRRQSSYLEKKLTDSDCPPGYSSMYSHGRSVGFLPPVEKIYEVEMLMRKYPLFGKKYLIHYGFTFLRASGLYEDADFTFERPKWGSLCKYFAN
jgi:hypothetical protein